MRKDIFSYLDQASTKKGFPHFFMTALIIKSISKPLQEPYNIEH